MIPATHQPPLPLDRLLLQDGTPGAADRMELDVLIVGAGPAGLACAIALAQLAERGGAALNIGVLEKAAALGEHSLSGAVVHPRALRDLFPDLTDADFPFRGAVTHERVRLLTARRAIPLPTPPTMRNAGYYVASLCEIVRWLGAKAEGLGVNLFTGFPAAGLLVEGQRVRGVRTAAGGLDRDGRPLGTYMAPNDLVAPVTVLAEGTRGLLAQAYFAWQGVRAVNPQIFALGVKEIWETTHPLDAVVHTLGWPLPPSVFGGSFLYPLAPNLVALGLVVGLDYDDAALDVHAVFQGMKRHPFFRRYLEGGEMVEWGAKTIPEGGYYSVPARRSGDGVAILGDAAGFVDVPSLKGIHYAMQSGMFAARAIFAALRDGDPSAARLAEYDRLVNESFIMQDLYRTRNMRLAFTRGLARGGLAAGVMTLTGGRFPGRRIAVSPDAAIPRHPGPGAPFVPDGKLTFSKVDAVFKSGNTTRDTIPTHLVVGGDVPAEVAEFYARMCPAGVYEVAAGQLRVNAPNCIDCKATDILGPRWTAREGGSGPRYHRM
ncbi:MAG TPA: electron-transfer flavoprotein:ubiquinone oxidoreductase [Gemmatimonadales bacterium]|jgi:electron-transferring-flavoprotein dehydrogenase|nr:electron-transfer flavoprotein:ubiquinone oxidoreductase [Gemmatimonadales bacterium]